MNQISLPAQAAKRLALLCMLLLCTPAIALAQSSTITTATASSLAGSATASSGETITSVDIAIRDGSMYWNGSAFQSGWIRVPATLSGSNWSYSFSPTLPQGLYNISVRAIDSGGNVQSPNTSTTLVLDSGDPTSAITVKTATQLAGTASDNPGGTGLSRVEVALRNSSSQYWNGSAFVAGYRRVTVSLSGGNWNYAISPSLPIGTYFVTSIAFDLAGNVQSPFFNTVLNIADSVKPTSTISSANETGISGTASDNTSVASVELAISNGSGFWNGSAFTSYNRVQASLSGSGSSVSWSYNFSPSLPAGSYSVTAIAFDSSGNVQTPFASQPFTVAAPSVLRVLALGDSITQGSYKGTGANTSIFSYRKRFTELLDASTCNYVMVGTQLNNNSASSFQSPHEGYSGHKVDHFINGLGANPGIDAIMAAQTPDVVLLHLGSNDMFRGDDVTSTISELITVINSIMNANSDAVILVANVIPWYGTSQFNANVQADIVELGNQIITMIQAFGNPQIRLANVRNGFYPFMMQQEDLIHPNSLGDNFIGNAFYAAFDQSGVCN